MLDEEYCGHKYIIISVMGPHASESEKEIFERKIKDVNKTGTTFWLMRSWQAKPPMVQDICLKAKEEGEKVVTIFVEPSSIGGATPTKTVEKSKFYSKNNKDWKAMPSGLTPVTGKMGSNAYALVFDSLKMSDGTLDLWGYANFFEQAKPVKIMRGASTLCAMKKNMKNNKDRIQSHLRRIVAIGELCDPYGVWLR